MKPRILLPVLALSALITSAMATLHADSLPADVYPGLRTPSGTLLPSVSSYLGQQMTSYDLPVDVELIKRRNNFGYTEEEIKKYFSVPLHMPLDETGMDKSYIKAPPAPSIHPRVIFNPEDVLLIKDRLQNTKAGLSVKAAIWNHLTEMFTGPNAKFGKEYAALVAGDQRFIDQCTLPYNQLKAKYPNESFPTPDPKSDPKGEKPLPMDRSIGFIMMYEAFRCLIDNDQAGGKNVAAAITTLSKIADVQLSANIANERARYDKALANYQNALKNPPKNGKLPQPPSDSSNDWRVVGQGPSFEGEMGLQYDFAYNFMTPEQRDTVRKFLVHDTAGMKNQGGESLRALHCGPSNWISWSCRALFPICAIEGEPGLDPAMQKQAMNAQLNFIHSMFASGEAFEGWGKDFIFFEHLVIMAKRGVNIIGSTSVRSAFVNYFVASLTPWGGGFTFCDSLAGSGGKVARNADVLMYHTLFPKDVAGDFIYRNQIDGDYAGVGPKSLNTHHPFATMDALCCAIFASDLMPTTWDEEYAQVTKDRPLTYYGEDTGNMITRSAWNRDALYMNYLTRTIPGGHQYCDRTHFSLYGLGRFWSIYHFMRQIHDQYLPQNRTVLTADGHGPSTMECRSVALADMPEASFTASDLSITWNYQNRELMKPEPGAELKQNLFNYNQFRIHPSPLPWMDYPIALLPNWYSSEKAQPNDDLNWFKAFDVKKAFRSAGVVRGPHPYALVVDDLQFDNKEHDYDWGMILDDDLSLGSIKTTSTEAGKASADIIIDEHQKPEKGATKPPVNDRHMLVRVLSASSLTEPAGSVGMMAVPNPPQRDMQINKLHVTSHSVSPEYKILLFPFRSGQPLPITTWNADHSVMTIAWPDQTDIITFTPGKDGRTRFSITRQGKELVSLN